VSKFESLPLKIEMVPQTLWHNNLRYLLKAKKWQEITGFGVKSAAEQKTLLTATKYGITTKVIAYKRWRD
jgi:hypothetical protein